MQERAPIVVQGRACWRGAIASLFVAVTTLITGCGESEYRAGLARTNAYYKHLAHLDENLAGPLLFGPSSGVQVSLRVPKQFVLIDPEPLPVDAEGNELPPPPGQLTPAEQMQPYYLGLTLPGMAGAYSVQMLTDIGGSDAGQPAFLYIMNNTVIVEQQQLADQGLAPQPDVDPTNLFNVVEEQLAAALGVETIPAGDDGDPANFNERFVERYPRADPVKQYHEQKTITEIRFRPEGIIEGFEVPYQFHLFEYEQAETGTQIAILLVAPEAVVRSENLDERIDLMLTTMELPKPRKRGGGMF